MLPFSYIFLRRAAAVAALTCVALAPPAFAQTAPPAASGEIAALKKQIEQKFPGARVGAIARTTYFGLYEVQFDDQLVYTDAKATYIFVGNIYETATKKNLTEAKLRQLNRVPLETLPYQLAFKRVKGNGERKLIVLSAGSYGNVSRLIPPLVTTADEVDLALSILEDSIRAAGA